jgi:hypothetical protein
MDAVQPVLRSVKMLERRPVLSEVEARIFHSGQHVDARTFSSCRGGLRVAEFLKFAVMEPRFLLVPRSLCGSWTTRAEACSS